MNSEPRLAEDEPDEQAAAYERELLRPPAVIKVINPVIQARNKHNRRRGKEAERAWAALITAIVKRTTRTDIEPPMVLGGYGHVDVLWWKYAFEIKQRRGDWPNSTVIRGAGVQAARHAQGRVPLVVACKTLPGLPREWRVYADSVMGGPEWIAFVLTVPQ